MLLNWNIWRREMSWVCFWRKRDRVPDVLEEIVPDVGIMDLVICLSPPPKNNNNMKWYSCVCASVYHLAKRLPQKLHPFPSPPPLTPVFAHTPMPNPLYTHITLLPSHTQHRQQCPLPSTDVYLLQHQRNNNNNKKHASTFAAQNKHHW